MKAFDRLSGILLGAFCLVLTWAATHVPNTPILFTLIIGAIGLLMITNAVLSPGPQKPMTKEYAHKVLEKIEEKTRELQVEEIIIKQKLADLAKEKFAWESRIPHLPAEKDLPEEEPQKGLPGWFWAGLIGIPLVIVVFLIIFQFA